MIKNECNIYPDLALRRARVWPCVLPQSVRRPACVGQAGSQGATALLLSQSAPGGFRGLCRDEPSATLFTRCACSGAMEECSDQSVYRIMPARKTDLLLLCIPHASTSARRPELRGACCLLSAAVFGSARPGHCLHVDSACMTAGTAAAAHICSMLA